MSHGGRGSSGGDTVGADSGCDDLKRLKLVYATFLRRAGSNPALAGHLTSSDATAT